MLHQQNGRFSMSSVFQVLQYSVHRQPQLLFLNKSIKKKTFLTETNQPWKMQESHTIFKYGIFITLIRLVSIPGSIWDFINLSRHTSRNCFTWDAVTLFSSNRTKMNRNNDKIQQSLVCVIMRLHGSGIVLYFYKHCTELTWWQLIWKNVYYSKLLPCRINFWTNTLNEVSKKYQYPSHF